jgi:cephalosporin hydroxylase
MPDKKLYSRQEFEELRLNAAREMVKDGKLITDALDIKVRAGRYYWVHQTTWFGEPVLQLPQDMFAIQEVVFKTRPRFIVELGVAWGGSLLFY